MTPRRALNVAGLPSYAFGHQGFIWWGTISFMVIEGAGFAIVLAAYYFLRTRVPDWPPSAPNPDPMFGTIGLLVLFASAIPNQLIKTAAERLDLPRVRMLIPVLLAFGAAVIVLRAFEFPALGVTWDYNAYASITWFILGLHTVHLVTDFADSVVLAALVFTGHMEPKRMVDVSENALYWYFIILSWVPVYLTVYFAPRWL
jgi:heme/copper-type cytochrome/quinol oxidase subunit 3